jgi:hypothetical protein
MNCPVGEQPGAAKCEECAQGRFSDNDDDTACKPQSANCEQGSYHVFPSLVKDESTCEDCEEGTYNDEGATETDSKADKLSPRTTVCKACPGGTISKGTRRSDEIIHLLCESVTYSLERVVPKTCCRYSLVLLCACVVGVVCVYVYTSN